MTGACDGLMMSFVQPNERAFWSSIDALTTFSWAGSGFLGGYLLHWFGWGLPLLFVCIGQSVAMLLYSIVIPFERSKKTNDAGLLNADSLS